MSPRAADPNSESSRTPYLWHSSASLPSSTVTSPSWSKRLMVVFPLSSSYSGGALHQLPRTRDMLRPGSVVSDGKMQREAVSQNGARNEHLAARVHLFEYPSILVVAPFIP